MRFGPKGLGFGEPAGEGDPPPEEGDERTFDAPPEMRAEGRPYLEGQWKLTADGVALAGESGSVSVVFEGASVTAVLSRIDEDIEPVIEMRLDGEPVPDAWMGDDTESDDDRAFHRVDRGSVYEWIRGVPFGIHHLDVRVSGAGVVLHHLSFGTTDVPEEE